MSIRISEYDEYITECNKYYVKNTGDIKAVLKEAVAIEYGNSGEVFPIDSYNEKENVLRVKFINPKTNSPGIAHIAQATNIPLEKIYVKSRLSKTVG